MGLVNNAGVAGSSEPVETFSLEHARYVHEVNVWGAVRMMQAFLPLLRHAKGRVINISRWDATPFCVSSNERPGD